MKELINLRRHLHQIAELSGQEEETSNAIVGFLKQTNPLEILTNIGGYGVAAIYSPSNWNKTIMFRAELDALPIQETNGFEYISKKNGVSHKCGHDGHMTILLGIAKELNKHSSEMNCRVILLFQPAEETAQGAFDVINDNNFNQIKPDYIFALHNLPGFTKGSVIIKDGIFASASKGIKVHLKGETSHAGHPEDGNSPVLAMMDVIKGLMLLPSMYIKLENAANITIIHAKLGEIAFGTSPGDADVMATFRTHRNDDMEVLTQQAIKLVEGVSATYELENKISWVEEFPATENDLQCTEIIKKAAADLNKKINILTTPFPWSEDFGWYTKSIKGAIFGLGAGADWLQLHNSHYDFPDEIIQDGVDIFKRIITLINNNNI